MSQDLLLSVEVTRRLRAIPHIKSVEVSLNYSMDADDYAWITGKKS